MIGRTRQRVAPLAILLVLIGCANPSTDKYSAGDVGQILETAEGTVVSSRVVDIQGDSKNVGVLAGGAAGATTGAVVGGGGSMGLLGAVLGGLLGAGTGYVIEESARSREGIEYVIRMDDGRVVTLVQNRADEEAPLTTGTPVLIQYGRDYTRVTGLPVDARGAAGGGASSSETWQNPDLTAPGQEPNTEVQQDQGEESESQ